MFGIGFGEFVIIVLVLIMAVGPEKLPALMKTVGRTLRQVKKTSEDLRRSTGIDDLMRENLWEEPQRTKPPRSLPTSPPEGTRAVESKAADASTPSEGDAGREETASTEASGADDADHAKKTTQAAPAPQAEPPNEREPASSADRSEADAADVDRKEGTH